MLTKSSLAAARAQEKVYGSSRHVLGQEPYSTEEEHLPDRESKPGEVVKRWDYTKADFLYVTL